MNQDIEHYLFCSERLGFRTWRKEDIPLMAEISANSEVMRFFPTTYDLAHTSSFVEAMNNDFDTHGYCYYAVDELKTGSFVGFIGLKWIELEIAPFNFTDIGWRLKPSVWGRGLATEGALCCLNHAFERLKLEEVFAIAPSINLPSISVMEKAGMERIKVFIHPKLIGSERLEECVLYRKKKPAAFQ